MAPFVDDPVGLLRLFHGSRELRSHRGDEGRSVKSGRRHRHFTLLPLHQFATHWTDNWGRKAARSRRKWS